MIVTITKQLRKLSSTVETMFWVIMKFYKKRVIFIHKSLQNLVNDFAYETLHNFTTE